MKAQRGQITVPAYTYDELQLHVSKSEYESIQKMLCEYRQQEVLFNDVSITITADSWTYTLKIVVDE